MPFSRGLALQFYSRDGDRVTGLPHHHGSQIRFPDRGASYDTEESLQSVRRDSLDTIRVLTRKPKRRQPWTYAGDILFDGKRYKQENGRLQIELGIPAELQERILTLLSIYTSARFNKSADGMPISIVNPTTYSPGEGTSSSDSRTLTGNIATDTVNLLKAALLNDITGTFRNRPPAPGASGVPTGVPVPPAIGIPGAERVREAFGTALGVIEAIPSVIPAIAAAREYGSAVLSGVVADILGPNRLNEIVHNFPGTINGTINNTPVPTAYKEKLISDTVDGLIAELSKQLPFHDPKRKPNYDVSADLGKLRQTYRKTGLYNLTEIEQALQPLIMFTAPPTSSDAVKDLPAPTPPATSTQAPQSQQGYQKIPEVDDSQDWARPASMSTKPQVIEPFVDKTLPTDDHSMARTYPFKDGRVFTFVQEDNNKAIKAEQYEEMFDVLNFLDACAGDKPEQQICNSVRSKFIGSFFTPEARKDAFVQLSYMDPKIAEAYINQFNVKGDVTNLDSKVISYLNANKLTLINSNIGKAILGKLASKGDGNSLNTLLTTDKLPVSLNPEGKLTYKNFKDYDNLTLDLFTSFIALKAYTSRLANEGLANISSYFNKINEVSKMPAAQQEFVLKKQIEDQAPGFLQLTDKWFQNNLSNEDIEASEYSRPLKIFIKGATWLKPGTYVGALGLWAITATAGLGAVGGTIVELATHNAGRKPTYNSDGQKVTPTAETGRGGGGGGSNVHTLHDKPTKKPAVPTPPTTNVTPPVSTSPSYWQRFIMNSRDLIANIFAYKAIQKIGDAEFQKTVGEVGHQAIVATNDAVAGMNAKETINHFRYLFEGRPEFQPFLEKLDQTSSISFETLKSLQLPFEGALENSESTYEQMMNELLQFAEHKFNIIPIQLKYQNTGALQFQYKLFVNDPTIKFVNNDIPLKYLAAVHKDPKTGTITYLDDLKVEWVVRPGRSSTLQISSSETAKLKDPNNVYIVTPMQTKIITNSAMSPYETMYWTQDTDRDAIEKDINYELNIANDDLQKLCQSHLQSNKLLACGIKVEAINIAGSDSVAIYGGHTSQFDIDSFANTIDYTTAEGLVQKTSGGRLPFVRLSADPNVPNYVGADRLQVYNAMPDILKENQSMIYDFENYLVFQKWFGELYIYDIKSIRPTDTIFNSVYKSINKGISMYPPSKNIGLTDGYGHNWN